MPTTSQSQLLDTRQPEADALVLFGATGDLAKRKLFPSLYRLEKAGALKVPVVGVARSDWTDDDFRDRAHESVLAAIPDADVEILGRMCARLDLVQGDYADQATWEELKSTLDKLDSQVAVYYMAIPPSLFPMVAEKLASVKLNKRGRIVVEKPFGRDLASAQELNATLASVFPETRIFRIDHYLGKEAVEDLLVFRFSNMLLEPVWNRTYIRSVQITMSETIGVEGRGSFYDGVGAIRDVLQNHCLQVLALLAMEPPAGSDSKYLQDEKAKVFASMAEINPADLVRGQYDGYLDEEGVAPGSTVETFVATKVMIDSWRWAGVPWYVRVGKALPEKATEAVIEFHRPPRLLFDQANTPPPDRNLIRFRMAGNEGVSFSLEAKTPGPHLDSQAVELNVDFAAQLGETADAYQRLLGDALAGNPARFARQDVVEQTWRIVQPILDMAGPVPTYERGSWGPAQAQNLLPGDSRWYLPS